jgi:uncharacterized SAM-binding protein YcdF (DUF218 family)
LRYSGRLFALTAARLQRSRRIGCGLQAANSDPDALVFCSGGVGRYGRSEAAVMSSRLQALGVSPQRLILDEESTDTFGSVVSVAMLARRSRIRRVVICSDTYHVPRIRTLLRMLGVESDPGPRTPSAGTLQLRTYMRVRESFAFGVDLSLMAIRRREIIAKLPE